MHVTSQAISARQGLRTPCCLDACQMATASAVVAKVVYSIAGHLAGLAVELATRSAGTVRPVRTVGNFQCCGGYCIKVVRR